MSDEKNANKSDAFGGIELLLESPPAVDSPMSVFGAGSLGDDAVLLTVAKLSLAESFMRQLIRDQGFADFAREILLSIMKVVRCEAGSLLEVNHAKNELFFRSVVGSSSDRVSGFVIPMGHGVVGHVAESRVALVVATVSENKMHLKAIQDAVGFEARNLVAVPVVIRGRIFGVIELLNRVGETNFTTSDLELLNYACEMASKAIEARLMIAWTRKSRQRGGQAA